MGGARVYRVGTPFNGVELAEIDFEQTADVMYLAHIDHPTNKLLRYGHTNWQFIDVTFGPVIAPPGSAAASASTPNMDAENDGAAYFPQDASYIVTAIVDDTGQESRASNTTSATNDLSLKGNTNTITWAAVTGASRYKVYKANNTQDFGYIGVTESLSFVDDNIGPALDQGPPVGNNPFVGAGNYPSTVTLFEQRLMLGRTFNVPNGIWGSKSGDFENMDTSRPLRDDDALQIGVVAGRVNAVNQLVSISTLLALTSDAIFKIDGNTDGGYLTATQARARRQIGRGSSRLSPLVVDNVVFYRPSGGSSVRSIGYSFEQDGYQATDVTIFSPHLFRKLDIVSWAYLQEPDSIIVAVRSDGKALCFTFEQEQQVWGWTLWETDGKFESVCAITEGGEDRLYVTVRRTVEGVERLYIERMASTGWQDPKIACYLDSAVTYVIEEGRTVFGNLHHLEGCTVSALVDGAVVRDLVVTNGQVMLPPLAGDGVTVTIGLPYEVTVETLPLVISSRSGVGDNIGRKQQLGSAVVSLIDAGDVFAGPTDAKLYRIKQRLDEPYGDADYLMQGDYRFDNESHVSGKVSVVIRQNAPLPLTITAVFLEPLIGG